MWAARVIEREAKEVSEGGRQRSTPKAGLMPVKGVPRPPCREEPVVTSKPRAVAVVRVSAQGDRAEEHFHSPDVQLDSAKRWARYALYRH